jgi:hypothetical protein
MGPTPGFGLIELGLVKCDECYKPKNATNEEGASGVE